MNQNGILSVPRWKILFIRPMYVSGVMIGIALVAGWFHWERVSNILFGAFIVTINVGWIYLAKLHKDYRDQSESHDHKHKTDIAYAILIFSGLMLLSSFLFALIVVADQG